jgi:hypothetical protein
MIKYIYSRFITYANNKKFRKPNNLKVSGSK